MSSTEHRRRAQDQTFWGRFRARSGWRDVIALGAVLLAGGAGVNSYDQGKDIQDGRKASAGFTCSVLSAVTEGGRGFIVAQTVQPVPEKAIPVLKKLGYPVPTKKQREQLAQLAGSAYVKAITDKVSDQAGPQAAALIRPDGSIDCKRQQQIAKIPT